MKNNIKLTILEWTLDIVLIIILSFIYYITIPLNSSKVVYVPQGSINKIITQMSHNHYDLNKLDSLLLRMIGSPQKGWINIGDTQLRKGDFLYKLVTSKAALQDIILIPGETTYIFLKQLSKQLNLNFDILQKEYKKNSDIREGLLVPDTYKIPMGITEQLLIKILIKNSMYKIKKISFKIFGSYNKKKWFHYVTIGSIIQKEAANKKEMPIISSVIYNRLKKGLKLQMDGTLNYGKYSHIKITHDRIRDDNSPYNTYKIKGLPPTPVCCTSMDAVIAAIFPLKTNYLYFMKSKSGTHNFACNYSTHLINIKRATK